MKLNFISSLDRETMQGGASLRIKSIIEIYKKLDFEVNTFFNNDGKEGRNFSAFLKTLWYSKNPYILFKKRFLDIPIQPYFHLDNLRQFSWKGLQRNKSFTIYNAHNLEFENFYGREDSFYKNNFIRYEIRCMKSSDLVFVCSDRERKIIIDIDPELQGKTMVLPNLIDSTKYKVNNNKRTILFVGTLSYYPNIWAVEYLCNTFSEIITEDMKKDYNFIIAGKDPSIDMMRLIEKSPFTLRSNLSQSEMVDLLAETKIHLVPLSHGSGTRLKIIEALISEGIVLSTPLGREGVVSKNIFEEELNTFPERFKSLLRENTSFNKKENDYILRNWDVNHWFDNNKDTLKEKLKI